MGTRIYEFGSFALDTSRRLMTLGGEVVTLAPKTFDLLLLFLESNGRALSKAELMRALWPDTYVEEANLSFQISTLRKALGEEGAKWIETLPRHGYRFRGDVHCVDQVADVSPAPPLAPAPPKEWTLWRPAAVATAATLVVILSVWLTWRGSRTSDHLPDVSPAVPLTAWPGHQQNPNLSPDGNQVVFSWDGAKSQNFDIYVKLVGPGEPIRLTTDPAIDDQPVWAPDGQSIAFVRFRSDIHADVFIIPALGGAERKVAAVNFSGRGKSFSGTRNLAWTPDGKWLAFGGSPSDGQAPGIWLIAARDGETRRLTTLPGSDLCDWAPAFTADGAYLAFLRERTLSMSQVYVMPLSQLAPTATPQRVSPHAANHLSVVWKPDRTGLLVTSAGHFGISRMYSIPFRPGRETAAHDVKLLPFGERARVISVTRNGRIVYAALFRDANLHRLALASRGHPAPIPIAASTLDEQTPDYSPDGKFLAFASTRTGVEEIWLANADGSNPKQMTSMSGAQCSNPRWSPDGKLVAFNSRRAGSADLYLLDPTTSETRRITDHQGEEVEPRWSRDGKWIYFGSNRTGRSEVWRMPSTGGDPVQVTREGGAAGTESPDGQYVYYAKYETSPNAIWRVPVRGGREEPVVDRLSNELNFVVADRGIYLVSVGSARNETSLDLFDLATHRRSTLMNIGKVFWWGMALAPDEKSLLYSVIDNSGSNLMLVENFR